MQLLVLLRQKFKIYSAGTKFQDKHVGWKYNDVQKGLVLVRRLIRPNLYEWYRKQRVCILCQGVWILSGFFIKWCPLFVCI